MTQTTETPSARGAGASPGAVEAALALDTLGTRQVAASMIAALGPLLVAAGTMPLAFAATGITAVPGATVLVACVLTVFIVGYLAMSRHVEENSGAFYALTGAGLGRPLGVVAGWLALVGYTFMQVSLYGFIGTQLEGFAQANFGWNLTWWEWALIVWALVGMLGIREINISARILMYLSLAEIAIVLVLSTIGLAHPAAGFHADPFDPGRISWAGVGPISAVIMLCFIGVEQGVVYGPEARDARRTVLRATIASLAGATVIYVLAAWAMDVFWGVSVTQSAGQFGADLFFNMGKGLPEATGHTLLLTGVIAAMLAYHNTDTRYIYAGARARILPSFLGHVGRSGVPRNASLLQSLLGLGTIGATQLFQWNPLSQLFYISSTAGGFTIMVLFAVTAIAVVAFFWRNHHGEHVAVRMLLPVLSALLLAGMVIACALNLPMLFGIATDDPTIVRLYALLGATVVLALARSAYLWKRDPLAYRKLSGPDQRAVRTRDEKAGAA